MICEDVVVDASRRLGEVASELDATWRLVTTLRVNLISLENQAERLVISIKSLRREIRANEKDFAMLTGWLDGVTNEPYRKDLMESVQAIGEEEKVAARRLAWRERRLVSLRVKIESTGAEIVALDNRLGELASSQGIILGKLADTFSGEEVLGCG